MRLLPLVAAFLLAGCTTPGTDPPLDPVESGNLDTPGNTTAPDAPADYSGSFGFVVTQAGAMGFGFAGPGPGGDPNCVHFSAAELPHIVQGTVNATWQASPSTGTMALYVYYPGGDIVAQASGPSPLSVTLEDVANGQDGLLMAVRIPEPGGASVEQAVDLDVALVHDGAGIEPRTGVC